MFQNERDCRKIVAAGKISLRALIRKSLAEVGRIELSISEAACVRLIDPTSREKTFAQFYPTGQGRNLSPGRRRSLSERRGPILGELRRDSGYSSTPG